MAIGLALRPVAEIVRLDDPERSLHADERAHPHERALDPLGALKSPVDQAPVEPDRMSGAHRELERDHEDDGRVREAPR